MSRTATDWLRKEGGRQQRALLPLSLSPSVPFSSLLLHNEGRNGASSPLSFPVHAPNQPRLLSFLPSSGRTRCLARCQRALPPPALVRSPLPPPERRRQFQRRHGRKLAPIAVTCPLSDKSCTEGARIARHAVSKSGSLHGVYKIH